MARGVMRSIRSGQVVERQVVEREEHGGRVERGDERLGGLGAADAGGGAEVAAGAHPGPLVEMVGLRALHMDDHLRAPDVDQRDLRNVPETLGDGVQRLDRQPRGLEQRGRVGAVLGHGGKRREEHDDEDGSQTGKRVVHDCAPAWGSDRVQSGPDDSRWLFSGKRDDAPAPALTFRARPPR
jgi:hypothetical protein